MASGWNQKPTVTVNVDHRLVHLPKRTGGIFIGNRSLTVKPAAINRSPEDRVIAAVTSSSIISPPRQRVAFLNTNQ